MSRRPRPNPIAALRRRWRRIDYLSAARPRTRWSRLADASLVVTFLLALPVAIAMEALVARDLERAALSGLIYGARLGALEAAMDDDRPIGDVDATLPFGEWSVRVTQSVRGWPIASRFDRPAPELRIRRYDEGVERVDDGIPVEAPDRRAVLALLERDGRDEITRALAIGGDEPASERRWRGTLASAGLWWIMLVTTCLLAIGVLRLATAKWEGRRHGRRAERARRNRCATCNYDLRGLEFHARCPECGTLIE